MLAMKLRMHFLGYIILFGVNALVVRGQFEDLRGCLTHKKFPAMMVRSFASKFLNMIGLNEAYRYATLDNIDFKNAFGTVDQTNFIADLIRFGHPSHWEYNNFDDFTLTDILSKLQENSNPDESLFEQMKRKKLNPQLKQFLTPVIDQLSLVKDRLNQIQDALNNPSDTHGNAGSFRSNEHLTELERIAKCFEGHTDEEFEDGISWVKCLYICKDLPLLSQAVAEVFAEIPECSRVPWLGDMILRVFVDFMELNTCFFEIVSPTPDAWPLQLPEGDPHEKFIEFRTYLPPGVHCFPPEVLSRKIRLGIDVIKLVFGLKKSCDVQIELSTSNYMQDALPYVRIPRVNATLGRPRCRNRTAINQAAIGWHENAINASGIIPLSETNWNSTFRIPIAAVVDHKVEEDPFNDVNFTMKMVVDGSRLNTTKIPMRVYDMDSRSQSVCQSVNDPHIVTFDNLYYNNLLQGYFVLYRNDFLPYEVQVIYQSCGSSTRGESCNCGVAVRSGDDVFVIDRCRLKNDSCTGDTCRVLKATLYVNGELTNGTRIFRLDGGLSYQVILPHGTLVKIKANGEEFLNVWVTPSPYDRNHTSGLCGTFNDQSSDDLTHPNNSRTDDATNAKDSPPIQFIQSWRVPAENRLFDGARPSNESFITDNFCLCSHLLIRGIECLCGYDKLVQTCDLELGDEFTAHNITAITKESRRYYNDVVSDDKRDVNESYIPIGSQSNYSDWQALQHCMTLLRPSNSHLLYQCNVLSLFPIPESVPSRDFDLVKQLMKNPIANAIYGCLDDIKITGQTDVLEWQLSALDAAKESCRMMIDRSTRVGERLVRRFENETCINNCYGRGVCAFGTCICNRGYTSSDCSLSIDRPPPILVMESRSLCDSRFDDCSFATIHGKNFTEDDHLACRIQPFKSKYTDVVTSTQAFDVDTWLINVNQIACLLPTSQSSYKISLMTKEGVTAGMFSFYVYDSVCFVCNPDRELCERKPDQSYCIIDNECFANTQRDSTDECRICNVSSSRDALYDSQEVKCVERREAEKKRQDDHRKEWTIRTAVSVGASALIILAAIILFIRERTQLRKLEKRKKEQGEGGTANGGLPEKAPSNELDPKKLSDVINQNHLPAIDISDSQVIYDNKAFVRDDAESGFQKTEYKKHIESPHENTSKEKANEISLTSESNPAYPAAITNLDLLRVKADVSNGSRSRKESMSSVKSASRVHQLIHEHHLDRRPSNASVGSYGIGGSGPLLFGCHRRMSQVCNPDAHDDEENFGIGGHGMPTIPSFSSGIEAPEYEQL